MATKARHGELMGRWRRCGESVLVAVVGYIGLRIGALVFPHSNILGGFALVFAPMYWAGLVGTLAFAVMGIVSTMTAQAAANRMTRGTTHSNSIIDPSREKQQEGAKPHRREL